MKGWESDKAWTDFFLPEIKQILSEYLAPRLFCASPIEEDREHNSDLIVLRMEPVRIACRIRKNEFLAKFGGQFTIRSIRMSGQETELAKILKGWGDYLFYGFADIENCFLEAWHICDLRVFRLEFHRLSLARPKGHWPPKEIPNTDGSSSFIPFSLADFPNELIIRRKSPEYALPQD